MLLRLAFRNLTRHPWRSLATVLGMALGIASVLATLSVGDNVQANVRLALEAAAGMADLLVAPGVEGRAVLEIAEVLPQVADTEGVAFALPVLTYRAEPVADVQTRRDSVVPGVGTGFQLSGRDLSEPDLLPAALSAGRWPEPAEAGLAIGEDFAIQRALEPGDEVRFATQFGAVVFTVTGYLDDASGLGGAGGGRVGVTALEDLQGAVRLGGRASYLEVSVAEGTPVETVRERLEQTLGESYTVTLPAGSGDFAVGVVDTLQAGLRVLAATLMALSGFMAYNTFAASALEREREYALLRTICLTRAQVQRLALLEAFFISLSGVAAGLLLGIGLAAIVTRLNAGLLGYEVRALVLPFPSLVLSSLIGLGVALVAGYLPARAASRTSPLAALRQVETLALERPRLGVFLFLLGVGAALVPWQGLWALPSSALALGLLFLGVVLTAPWLLGPAVRLLRPLLARAFGSAGRLGADFTMRNRVRNGVAVAAVALGTTLIVGVGGMVAGINQAIRDWVETTVVGDLFVTSPVGFPEDFEALARERVPALEEASGVGIRVVRFQPEGERARSVALVLVDPERFDPETGFGSFQYIAGEGDDQSGYDALLAGGQVLAANTLRERFGLSRGDTVQIRTGEGFRDFRVGGVVVDFTGGGEAFIASLADVERFGGGAPDLYVMTLAEGGEAEAARSALQAAFPELYLDVSLNQDYRARILSLTRQTFVTTNGLLALAVVIAALGVANTLGMNLSERQRDIAMLRTLGLSRGGVGRVVMSEGLVLVVLGTVLGVFIGLLLSRVNTTGANALTGFVVEPVFPWFLILLALLASPLVGLLASWLPARRAARLEPVVALGGAL